MTRAIRIANASAGYGDRFEAPLEMVEGGPIDVLTGDYLAELTTWILWRARQRDESSGYAVTFLEQMEAVLSATVTRGIRVVTNAGGLNPSQLAQQLRALASRLGVRARIAHVEGDDLLPAFDELQASGHRFAHADTGRAFADTGARPVTVNAYLGSWGIVEALRRDADIVVCPRVTDAALTVGPAAWFHGWEADEWDRLAAAVVAGHLLECGTHVTGGNYAFFTELDDALPHPGFPIAEIDADGTVEITKHPGHRGRVTRGTVTAQLLYEIAGPRYPTPDVVAHFDTVTLTEVACDRVRVSGVRGDPPPTTAKVGITYQAGFRNSMTFVLVGLDVPRKAKAALAGLVDGLGGTEQFTDFDVRMVRADRDDPSSIEEAVAYLTVTVKGPDRDVVGRKFSDAFVQMGLANYPGYHLTTPPSRSSPYGVYWPTTVPVDAIHQVVVDDSGRPVEIPPVGGSDEPTAAPVPAPLPPDADPGPTTRVPLGRLFGARSGDKGGTVNVGVWAADAASYGWLLRELTEERFRTLIPRSAELPVERHCLPNVLAVNFVVKSFLGDGVSANTDLDPQGKALGELLRARLVDVPAALLEGPTAAR